MMVIFIKNLLQASLVGSIGFLITMILQKTLFKRYTRTFCYYIWIATIFKMLIPFKIPIYISKNICIFGRYSSINIRIITNNSSLLYNVIGIKSSTIIEPVNSITSINYFTILFYLWLIISIILVVYHFVSYINFNRKIKYFMYDVFDNSINDIYSKLILEMNIKKKIPLKFCSGISTPFGIGMLNAYIVLPEVSYHDKEIKYILKHELMHYKRHDMIYKLILLITATVHWFNPLVYILIKSINNDCELSCDEAILEDCDIEGRKLYASTIVNSLRLNKKNILRNDLTTEFSNSKDILKRRLENMLNLKTRKNGIIIGALTAVITVSSIISLNVFAQNNTNKSTSNKISSTNSNKSSSTNSTSPKKFHAGDIIQGITIVSVDEQGRPTKIKYKHNSNLTPEKVDKILGIPGNGNMNYIKNPPKYKKYTYGNAPTDVKAKYEADAKSVNAKISSSDEILVPIK